MTTSWCSSTPRCGWRATSRRCSTPTTGSPGRAATRHALPRRPAGRGCQRHTDRQSTLVVRTDGPILDPAWSVTALGLEDLVLAYMADGRPRPAATAGRAGGAAVIWLSWRQFRAPRHDRGGRRRGRRRRARRHRPPAGRPRGGRRRRCSTSSPATDITLFWAGVILVARGPRRRRRLLGRPAGGPRARGGHLPAGLDPVASPAPAGWRRSSPSPRGRGRRASERSRWP